MSVLNITARLTCFTRQRTSSPTTSSFTTPVTSSSIRALEVSEWNLREKAEKKECETYIYI